MVMIRVALESGHGIVPTPLKSVSFTKEHGIRLLQCVTTSGETQRGWSILLAVSMPSGSRIEAWLEAMESTFGTGPSASLCFILGFLMPTFVNPPNPFDLPNRSPSASPVSGDTIFRTLAQQSAPDFRAPLLTRRNVSLPGRQFGAPAQRNSSSRSERRMVSNCSDLDLDLGVVGS